MRTNIIFLRKIRNSIELFSIKTISPTMHHCCFSPGNLKARRPVRIAGARWRDTGIVIRFGLNTISIEYRLGRWGTNSVITWTTALANRSPAFRYDGHYIAPAQILWRITAFLKDSYNSCH